MGHLRFRKSAITRTGFGRNAYFFTSGNVNEMNPTVPNMTGFYEVENLMTSLPVFDDYKFSGCFQKYIILPMLKF